MKRNSQKGSIAIFVLIALLFYIGFLLLLYANNLNKAKTIEEKTEILKNTYEKNVNEDSINDIYNRNIGVAIGDYVNYNELLNGKKTYSVQSEKSGYTSEQKIETEDLKWRVLKIADNGQTTLISNNPTTATLNLKGENGYLNAEEILNDVCKQLYGNGNNVSEARSLKVEDINELANYTPTTAKWTYRYPTMEEANNETRYLQCLQDGDQTWTDITGKIQTFKMPGEETIGKISDSDVIEGSKELEDTYYFYYLYKRITDSKILDMILKENSTISQWLASRCVRCRYGGVYFGVHFLDNNNR